LSRFRSSPPDTRRTFLVRLAKGAAAFWLAAGGKIRGAAAGSSKANREVVMQLPPTVLDGTVSVERAIRQRRTVRRFAPQALTLEQLSHVLWAAAGITEEGGFKRAAPSAGALYPMDVYAVIGEGKVAGIEAGTWHYQPAGQRLDLAASGDRRESLARTCLSQIWMAAAPLSVVITAEYARAAGKYGERAVRYAMIEAGHIGQNIFLQAEALGLAASIVGAFDDRNIQRVLCLPPAHQPLLVMPIGYRAGTPPQP
jgi:SagB-type dehydrogenase family enzyme